MFYIIIIEFIIFIKIFDSYSKTSTVRLKYKNAPFVTWWRILIIYLQLDDSATEMVLKCIKFSVLVNSKIFQSCTTWNHGDTLVYFMENEKSLHGL